MHSDYAAFAVNRKNAVSRRAFINVFRAVVDLSRAGREH